MTLFSQAAWGGLVTGAAYGVLALGFTLIFGVLKILQFSHPQIFAAGAFVGYAVATNISTNIIVILFITLAVTGLIGLAVERLALRPLRDEYFLTPAVSTISAGIVIQNVVILVAGPDPLSFPEVISRAGFDVGGITVQWTQIVVLGISLLVMLGLMWVITRTKAGRAMRASAEATEVAQIFGIDTKTVATVTMATASALAGVAGILIAVLFGTFSPFMDTVFGLKGMVIMVVAGLGSIGGAMTVGIGLGITETVVSQYIPSSYRDVFVYGLLMIVLLVRPAGLFGQLDPTKV